MALPTTPINDFKEKYSFFLRCLAFMDREKSRRFIAGSISGTTAAILLQPLDVIRTFQQGTFSSNIHLSTTNACRHIIQEKNVFALWRGLSPTLIRICCGAGIYFVTLNQLLSFSLHSFPSFSYLQSKSEFLTPSMKSNSHLFISGALARTFAGCILAPFTVMKAQMEWQSKQETLYRNLIHAFKYDGGIHGLYRGFGVTVLRDVPFSGFYVLFYKRLQHGIEEHLNLHHIRMEKFHIPQDTFTNLTSGLIAGILATTITHPLDVVKTRIQLSRFEKNQSSKTSLNMIEIIKKIGQHDGYMKGFSRGIVPRVLKRTFSTAITWTVYESITKQLNLKSV